MYHDPPQLVNSKGKKYTECPFYGQCLSHAVKHLWQHWSCGSCGNHLLAPIYKKLHYIENYYGLLAEIYPEFRRKYEHFMEAHNKPAT